MIRPPYHDLSCNTRSISPLKCRSSTIQVLSKIEGGNTYDIILMDIHMPEMDGLEATRRICQKFPKPEDRPRIVALSADTLQDLHDRCGEWSI